MKKLFFLLSISILTSCSEVAIDKVSNQEVFESLWQHVKENYIYFEVKRVDWDSIKTVYAPQVQDNLSNEAFFNLCLNMLNELRDNHNSLRDEKGNSYSYNFTTGYNIVFDEDIIKNNYLKGNFQEKGFYTYGVLEDSIGYIHLQRFANVWHIDEVMRFMNEQSIKGIIIDIRNNPGGNGEDAVDILGYFIEEAQKVGYIVEKTGPNPNDFSPPLSITALPKSLFFDIPIHLITNRRSYSASTYLTGMMKDLPHVELIGQITGGGGAGNTTYELPNSWLVTVSVNKYIDVHQEEVEEGIQPNIEVENDSMDIINGVDKMLERALEVF